MSDTVRADLLSAEDIGKFVTLRDATFDRREPVTYAGDYRTVSVPVALIGGILQSIKIEAQRNPFRKPRVMTVTLDALTLTIDVDSKVDIA